MSLRPSNLPKLAVCACYESNPVAGPAAARGRMLDRAFRAELLGLDERKPLSEKLTADENSAVKWAVAMVQSMAGGERIFADEEDCRVQVLGIPGTADAVVPTRLIHFDLKSGVKRNYREQMAAYALAFMEACFATSWTAHLLYCDLREIETLRFTYEEAFELVDRTVKAFHDPGKSPTPCEYCSWCAKADTCPARLALVADGLKAAKDSFDFDAVVADAKTLSEFLRACAVVEEFRDRAKKAAVERLKTGGELPGWRLVTRRGPQFIDPQSVGHHIKEIGFGPVLSAYGNLSANKFRRLWDERMPADKPFPEETVKHGPPSTYLKQQTSK